MITSFLDGTRRRKQFNMDDLEIYWALYTIIFYLWFRKTSLRNKIIALIIILIVPSLKGPLISTGLLLVNLFSFGYLNFTELSINYLFNTCLTPIFTGYKLPLKATIIVANYPTNYIEYMANQLFCNKKICFVVLKTAFIQSRIVQLYYSKENVLFVSSKGSFDTTQNIIRDKIEEGFSIFVYVEEKYHRRPKKYSVQNLRQGMFKIAKNLHIPITPIVFDHIDHTFGILEQSTYKIFIDKTRFVEDIDYEMEQVHKLYKNKLKKFKIK
jgi:hypothetical protein